MLVAWALYPLVLVALCVGLGLLVDALAGRRLPGTLLAPAGLAAIVAVGSPWAAGKALATASPVLLALALLGALSLLRLDRVTGAALEVGSKNSHFARHSRESFCLRWRYHGSAVSTRPPPT